MLAEPIGKEAVHGLVGPLLEADHVDSSTAVAIWLVDLDRAAARTEGKLARDTVAARGLQERRSVTARACLRELLGRQSGKRPTSLEFRIGLHGKPELRDRAAAPAFNLAHSGKWACIAMGRMREIGVDVERVRPIPDALRLAERFLPAAALDTLRSLPPGARDLAFLSWWTREEALRKAEGTGLLDGRSPWPRFASGREWFVEQLALPRGLVGAVAGTSRVGVITLMQLDLSKPGVFPRVLGEA